MTTGIILEPTNTCFDDALEYLETKFGNDASRSNFKVKNQRYRLGHGILINPWGEHYAHAWVEELQEGEWVVIHSGILNNKKIYCCFKKEEYYKEMKAIEHTLYTMKEVLELNLECIE